MININEVIETNEMVRRENLDVRTITIGISLLPCQDSDPKKLNQKVYDRICTVAQDLSKTAETIEAEFGIPVVNKRISCTPAALLFGSAVSSEEEAVSFAKTMDRAAEAAEGRRRGSE